MRLEFRLYGPGTLWIDDIDTSNAGGGGDVAPVNTGLPSIAGTAQVGGTLSASPGSWSGSPAPGFAYQWLRCASACVPIGGAVGQTYSPVGLDVGGTLEVVVTGSNSAGSSSATSAPTGSVSAGGGGDLAPDPDLEADPAGSYYTGGSAVFSWASDAAHSPTHALKIASGSGSLARWMSQASLLPVRAGSSYSVSAFLKLAAVGGSAFVTVGYYDAGGGFLGNGASSQALSGTRDWTQVGLQVTPPAGATLMRLEFRLYGPGTLWIDDITASSG
jgi:hypothetical protein